MDFPFVKEALAQLFSKPSTMAFPAAPSPAKPNYRGRIVFHPDKCISCNMCERVCAGQAITHTSEPCEEGERITRQFYLGSCPQSGNVFRGSYSVCGPLSKYVHVDVDVAGCTPKPEAVIEGLATATKILMEKRKNKKGGQE